MAFGPSFFYVCLQTNYKKEDTIKMTIPNLTFGVELEGVGLHTSRVKELLEDAGFQPTTTWGELNGVSLTPYSRWDVRLDGTVYSYDGGPEVPGYEIVSPILRGQDGLDEVVKVCNIITAAGGWANDTCGLHVHVGSAHLNVAQCCNVYNNYNDYEHVIDQLVPADRRGNNHSFCRTLFENKFPEDYEDKYDLSNHRQTERDCKVNLRSIRKPRETIEFRHQAGTFEPPVVTAWVKFILNFVKEGRDIWDSLLTLKGLMERLGLDEETKGVLKDMRRTHVRDVTLI